MTEDFVFFPDANVVIAASIFGYIGPLKQPAQHIHYDDSRGLLSRLCTLQHSSNPQLIGYISPIAESEARREINNAIRAVLSKYWKDQKIDDDKKEQLADSIETFFSKSSTKLEEFLSLLCREPPNLLIRDKAKKQLRYEFDNLNPKTKPPKHHKLGEIIEKLDGIPFIQAQTYVPGIEDTDLEILADAYAIGRVRLKKTTYVASLNTRHMASKVASKMLEEKFSLIVRTPDIVLNAVNKRYGRP
ncbi:MAG: hypothetical protein WC861_05565 [Candidatus Micrarchaeia archaeon]|jgi:hypothetical protein